MKVTRKYDFLLGVFYILIQNCWAQRGYNYARPSSNTAGIASPIRPIVAAQPTSNAAPGTGYPAAATAFGAPSNANVVPSTASFGGFQSNLQSNLSPSAPLTAIGGTYGAGTSAGLPSRSSTAHRQGSSVFGSNTARGQSTQFASSSATATGSDVDYDSVGDYSAIPGLPGVDYPIYSLVPQTSFDCSQQPLPGYYSDVEAQCQVFHICALNRTFSFLCPNGTVFSQETLVCVWWNQYDCSLAPTLYANNAFIYDYGNERASTNMQNYQQNSAQAGPNAISRPQGGYQIATNNGRTVAPSQSTGIFGSSVAIRPSSFGGVTTPLTPAPVMNFVGGNIRPQTGAYLTAAAQTLPDTSVTPASIGSFVRGGSDASAVFAGGVASQQNSLQTSQLSLAPSQREYLPPSRRT